MMLNRTQLSALTLSLSLSVSLAQTNSLHLPPIAAGPFKPDWNSLTNYQAPEWFRDAKFGIWAHWGPQCQPEHGDWYARGMYQEGGWQYKTHIAEYGHPSTNGFKDVIHVWKAERFDPDTLLKFYKDNGARIFMALANHHDNFDNFNSKYQPWNSVALEPQKDLIGGWAKAARKNGLRFGVSVHASHAWTWYESAQGADTNGPLAGVPYDGKLTKADGKGQWWEGLDPQDLYAQNHKPGDQSGKDIAGSGCTQADDAPVMHPRSPIRMRDERRWAFQHHDGVVPGRERNGDLRGTRGDDVDVLASEFRHFTRMRRDDRLRASAVRAGA